MFRVVMLGSIVALLGARLVAQHAVRESGEYRVFLQWESERCQLWQSTGGPTATKFPPDQLVIEDARSSDRGFVPMPIDVPGTCLDLGEGRFLVGGAYSGTGEGAIVLMQLVHDPLSAVIDATVWLGTDCDPTSLWFDRERQRLFLFDAGSGYVHMAAWKGDGDLPEHFAIVADAWRPATPCSDLQADPGGHGVWIVAADAGHAPARSSSHLQLTEPVEGVWLVEDHVAAAATSSRPARDIWKVRDEAAIPESGSIEMFGNQGYGAHVFVRDEATQREVFSIPAMFQGAWHTIEVPAGVLSAGRRYRIVGGAPLEASASFSPSIRLGAPSVQDGARLQIGRMQPLMLQVGNPRFAVGGRVTDGRGAKVWLLAAAAVSAGDVVEKVNTNTVLLAHPCTALPVPVADELVAPMPLPVDDTLAGEVVYFQWVLLPEAGPGAVSDVFGSRILPRLGRPAVAADEAQSRSGLEHWLEALPGGEPAAAVQQRFRDSLR